MRCGTSPVGPVTEKKIRMLRAGYMSVNLLAKLAKEIIHRHFFFVLKNLKFVYKILFSVIVRKK